MKRGWMAPLIIAPLVLLLHSASLAQSSDLLVLSKNANGPVFRSSLSLALTSNADCDQTQRLIPDGSRLVSDSFNLNTDSAGLGTFSGFAQIVAPDGRIVLQGWLRGTAGVNTRRDPNNKDCGAPGRLEGIFEGMPTRSITRAIADAQSQVIMLNFAVEPNPLVASPLPIYRGGLDGVITPPSIDRVSVTTERNAYDVSETIVAKITNGNDQSIVTWDHQSNCTIITLQKQEANRWANIAPCPLLSPSILVKIGPRMEMLVILPPGNSNARYEPGTYRLEFIWFFIGGDGLPVGNPVTTYSPQFTLTSKQ